MTTQLLVNKLQELIDKYGTDPVATIDVTLDDPRCDKDGVKIRSVYYSNVDKSIVIEAYLDLTSSVNKEGEGEGIEVSKTIIRGNLTTVFAYKGTTVFAREGTTVFAREGTTVFAYEGSKVFAYEGSKVFAYEGSKVFAKVGSLITSYPGSDVVWIP